MSTSRTHDGEGTAVDLAGAAKWYGKSAAQGNAWAQLKLGLMYKAGEGVTQSDSKAVELIRQAADQGNSVAQASLRGAS